MVLFRLVCGALLMWDACLSLLYWLENPFPSVLDKAGQYTTAM
jgi:hypothetical protein